METKASQTEAINEYTKKLDENKVHLEKIKTELEEKSKKLQSAEQVCYNENVYVQ